MKRTAFPLISGEGSDAPGFGPWRGNEMKKMSSTSRTISRPSTDSSKTTGPQPTKLVTSIDARIALARFRQTSTSKGSQSERLQVATGFIPFSPSSQSWDRGGSSGRIPIRSCASTFALVAIRDLPERGSDEPPRLLIGRIQQALPRAESGEEQLEVFASQVSQSPALPAQDRIGKIPLGTLEFQDLFLNRIFGDQSDGKNRAGLADSVSSVDRLSFNRGIPPGVEQNHHFRFSQIETKPSRLQADQEKPTLGIGPEFLHGRG